MATKRKKRESGDAVIRQIGEKKHDISKYEKVQTSAGHTSFDNGDEAAKTLRGKDLDKVYEIVARKTKIEEKELRNRFKNLNAGMQRMNLGNMLRKALRAAEEKKAA